MGRVGTQQRLEVGDDLRVPAQRQCDLGTLGVRRPAQVLQPHGLGHRPRLGGEVGERVAAPEPERGVVGGEIVLGRASRPGDRSADLPDPSLEGLGVDAAGVDGRPIAAAVALHQVQPDGLEHPAQLGDPELERVQRIGRQRRVGPQPVDERRGRNDPATCQEQHREQGPLRRAGDLDGLAVDRRLEGAEQPEADVTRGRQHVEIVVSPRSGDERISVRIPVRATTTPGQYADRSPEQPLARQLIEF